MSPGPTFARVYRALKQQLMEGRFEAGSRLEPALLGEALYSSITPVRDALHQLVGEGLVLAPHHNGFRVPLLTEAELRALYDWHGRLLLLATQDVGAAAQRIVPEPITENLPVSALALFASIARHAANAEQRLATVSAGERLAPFMRVEAHVLDDLDRELKDMADALANGELAMLRDRLRRHRRRRERAVPAILAARQQRTA